MMGGEVTRALGDGDDCARGAEPPHAASRTATANAKAFMYPVTANRRNGYAATLLRGLEPAAPGGSGPLGPSTSGEYSALDSFNAILESVARSSGQSRCAIDAHRVLAGRA